MLSAAYLVLWGEHPAYYKVACINIVLECLIALLFLRAQNAYFLSSSVFSGAIYFYHDILILPASETWKAVAQ